jgi:probable phosphoglycerate mutase
MTLLVLLRHGPTAANREHRLQGRSDPPLDSDGRAAVARWQLPPFARAISWRRSPLRRCAETAALLGLAAEVEPTLIEMDWGAWEGRSLAELRSADPTFAVEEARGLDLTPPGGESPRQVQTRLGGYFREITGDPRGIGAISHKGIIRAVYAMATGWDMIAKPAARLRWDALHVFRLDAAGQPTVERLNCTLIPE